MKNGDISNDAPFTIVIDIDGLVIESEEDGLFNKVYRKTTDFIKPLKGSFIKRKVKNYKVIDQTARYLENAMFKDFRTILFAHRNPDYADKYFNALENKFAREMVHYNKLYVGNEELRERILAPKNVKKYFYTNPLHSATHNKKIEEHLDDWSELHF